MKSIKLNNLAKETLSKKEMNEVKGGGIIYCGCACRWEGTSGGSSNNANGDANDKHNLRSPFEDYFK